jgi:hypothetical protein
MQSVKNENVYSLFPNQRIQSSHGSAAAATPTVQIFRGLSARVHAPPPPDPDPARRGPNPPETHAAKRAARTDRVPPAPRSVCSHRTFSRALRSAAPPTTLCLSIAFASPQTLPIEFFLCLPTPPVHHELTAFRELASARDGRRRQRRGAQDRGGDGLLAEQQEGAGLGHRQPAPP